MGSAATFTAFLQGIHSSVIGVQQETAKVSGGGGPVRQTKSRLADVHGRSAGIDEPERYRKRKIPGAGYTFLQFKVYHTITLCQEKFLVLGNKFWRARSRAGNVTE
jgi:hypothetical protein